MEVKLLLFAAAFLLQTLSINSETITCKSISARFKGIFQNVKDPNAILAVDLQTRVSSVDFFNRTFFTMNYWNNENVDLQSGVQFWARDFEHDWKRCNPFESNDCFLPYVSMPGYFVLDLGRFSNDVAQNWFQFLYIPNYRNAFTFDAIDGKCTNVVQGFPNEYGPRTELFKACMCCDDYNPSSFLNCPERPLI
ncbi:hypothetical protein M3Y97_01153400 [Aphelenchoides bicaudatus]|nr:hypothetical protein M3Y97_01153400 [Aphelenchoides bicaudatus]